MKNLSVTCLVLTLLVSGMAICQSNPKLHTPAEIFKIMEESKIQYVLTGEFDSASAAVAPPVLPNNLFLQETNTGYSLVTVTPSEDAQSYFNMAEESFRSGEYSKAIELYNKVFALQPDFSPALMGIGDSYFHAQEYDSAIAAFTRAICVNFADYQSHWFLADTYWKSGHPDSAMREITIAHVLNVNNQNLKKAIMHHRETGDRAWDDWNFIPQYALSQSGDKVTIDCKAAWLGYALVKALWKYEPGYAESMIGKTNEKVVVNWPEEKEAILASLANSVNNDHLPKIIAAGYINEFILYEIAARKAPSVMALLPRETFNRVVEYVDKFH